MKKVASKHLLVIVLVMSGLFFVQCKDAAIQKLIEVIVATQQKTLPMDASPIYRVDSCMAMPNKTIRFCLTAKLMDVADLDVKSMESLAKAEVIYLIQTNAELEQARKLDVSFAYAYYDKNGKLISEITVSPEDYNKPIIKPQQNAALSITSPQDLTNAIETLVAAEKAQLPAKAINGVTMTSCQALQNNVIEYKYKVESATATIMQKDTSSYKSLNKPAIVNILKYIPVMKSLIQNGVTLHYVYADMEQHYLFTLVVDENDL